jgi:uncharacterized protein YneR
MDQNKIQEIFKSVLDGLKSKLEDLDKKGSSFYNKIQIIQSKLNNHIKNSCGNQLEWFKHNGTVQDGENGLSLSVNENIDSSEAKNHLDDFKACVNQNDFGLEAYFQTTQNQQQDIEQRNNNCIEKCLQNQKDENVFKNCITSCFTNTINEMNNSFEAIDKKLGEITNKL